MNTKLNWVVVGLFGLVLLGAWGQYLQSVPQSPAITAADGQRAQYVADAERAKTAAAWANTTAIELSAPDVAVGRGWAARLSGLGFGLGVFVLCVGGAFAAVQWANVRARVVYPRDGLHPVIVERRRDGELLVIDTGRGLASVTRVLADGVELHYSGADEVALAAVQSQLQAGAVVGASGHVRPTGGGVQLPKLQLPAGDVTRVPSFASQRDSVRLVYVRGGRPPSDEDAVMADLREFITRGAVVGFARRTWLGAPMPSGQKMGRGMYDDFCGKLQTANVTTPDGKTFRLSCAPDEVLNVFGLQPIPSKSDDEDAPVAAGAE